MSKGTQEVYFQFEGHSEIIKSHNWRLEMDVNLHRNRLGLPYWTKYKTIPYDDVDPNPEQDLTALTDSSNDGNINKSAVVSKSTRKRKTKPKANELPDVQHVLDQFIPADNLPESPTTGTDDTLSDSMDK